MTQTSPPTPRYPGPLPPPPPPPGWRPGGAPVPAAGPGGPPLAGANGSGRRSPARGSSRLQLRRLVEGTPGHLRVAGALAVVACLLFSVLGTWAFQSRASSLADARADAAQLLRVQQITTDVVAADAVNANGYLAGTLTGQQRALFDQYMSSAAVLVVGAAQANPADAAQLKVVNDLLTQYADAASATRTNGRQGLQVATGYLRQASVLLRGNSTGAPALLPTLQQLTDANEARVESAYDSSRRAAWILAGSALVPLGGLIAVQVWLARRTRRFVNVPLAAASVAVVLVLVVGAAVMASVQSNANTVHDTSYTALRGVAGARISGYTARSAESTALLYLYTGGDSATARKTFDTATATAQQRLNTAQAAVGDLGIASELGAWKTADNANWKAATTGDDKALVTAIRDASSDTGTISTSFAAFDSVTSKALAEQADAVDGGLESGRTLVEVLGWLALVVGVLAAIASWAGIGQRMEEYR